MTRNVFYCNVYDQTGAQIASWQGIQGVYCVGAFNVEQYMTTNFVYVIPVVPYGWFRFDSFFKLNSL